VEELYSPMTSNRPVIVSDEGSLRSPFATRDEFQFYFSTGDINPGDRADTPVAVPQISAYSVAMLS